MTGGEFDSNSEPVVYLLKKDKDAGCVTHKEMERVHCLLIQSRL